VTRTELPTTIVECSCWHCAKYAERKGLALPLRAEVNVKMNAAICTTPEGVHAMVKKAIQPPFGHPDPMQAKFGPWVA